MALRGFGAKCMTGWGGVDGVDNHYTVMTTRAPALLINLISRTDRSGWGGVDRVELMEWVGYPLDCYDY